MSENMDPPESCEYASVPIDEHENPEMHATIKRPADNKFTLKKGAIVSVLVVALIAVGAFVSSHSPTTTTSFVEVEEELTASNEFERRTDRPFNDGLFKNLVRVHSPTTLELQSGKSAIFHAGPSEEELTKLNSNPATSIEHTFTEIGRHVVKVEVGNEDGTSTTFTYSITAKVIRMELRDLTQEDREIYFGALRHFQFTTQNEGVAKYGSTYRSLEYILRSHLYGAADKACDHWHDDAGMINHHVAITWTFEQSLRMIDSRTASHYWDYTREVGSGTDWYDSNIFDDDWFGDNSPNNPLHVVDKGRFAYSPVLRVSDFSDIVNPYGLLRSPWNTNPTPYLMRYNKTFYKFADGDVSFPKCSQFAAVLSSSLANALNALNGELHGPVHIMIGGHWDSASDWKNVGEYNFADDRFLLLSKWLWRQGFVRTPDSCSEDTPHSECMPTCPEGIVGDWDSMTPDDAYSILVNTGVLDLQPEVGLHKSMVNNGLDWRDLLQELCHVGSPGDAYSSAAPQDPTFWPLHGNAERLISVMRIYKNRGIIDFDETWGYFHSPDLPSQTGVVCDWSEATGTLDMPSCAKGTCSGHKEDDLLPFTHLYKGQGETLMTNAEFYERINPLSDELPYAYDSLFYWQSCHKENIMEQYKFSNGDDDASTDDEVSTFLDKLIYGLWGVM